MSPHSKQQRACLSSLIYVKLNKACDSCYAANDRDYTAHDDHDKPQSHQTDPQIIKGNHLPGPWRDCRVNTDQRDDEHAMLLCHRSTELVRRAGDFSCCANVSGEDGQNGCDVTECNISAPREAGSNEYSSVRNAIGYLVVEFTGFRRATGSDGNHPIEHIRSQAQLRAKGGDEPQDSVISN